LILICGMNFSLAQTSGQITMNQSGSNSGSNAQIAYLLGPIADRDRKTSDERYGIQGSAYTTDKFEKGKLYYGDDYEGDIYYRYNAYYEEIEITKVNLPGAQLNTLNRDKEIRLISSNGNTISFKTFIDKKSLTQNGYLTKLRDGKYSLYKRTDIKYTPSQKPPNSFTKPIPARFTPFYEYYLEIEGVNKINELQLSKRKILKLLPQDKRESVKKFIKTNNIRIKDEYSVFKILDFLNEK